jgi:hypothetical protein
MTSDYRWQLVALVLGMIIGIPQVPCRDRRPAENGAKYALGALADPGMHSGKFYLRARGTPLRDGCFLRLFLEPSPSRQPDGSCVVKEVPPQRSITYKGQNS